MSDGPPQPLHRSLNADARRFEIQRCLGSGGFGEVYLATMVSPAGVRSEVAVKVLHEGLDPRSQAVQRLRDEGRLLGTLNHPSVLKVHDLVMLGERVALVMEYVPGLDLEGCFEVLGPVVDGAPTRGISLRAGLEVLGRVSDALHTAWNATGPDGTPLHLVHRDIKPSNIRVGLHGEVKLLDFGIAKAADARREAKTQTRVTIGSPWYMGPERFDGVSDHPASDVYALGCTLYELTTGGTRLFDALSPRQHFLLAMDDTAHDAHVRGHLERVQAPGPVLAVLRAMLAFSPDARPEAGSLGPRFDDLVEGMQGIALRRWCRELTWPELPDAEGALVGKIVTEARLSGLATPDTPAPQTRDVEPAPPTLAVGATYAVGGLAAETLPPVDDPSEEAPAPPPAPPEPEPPPAPERLPAPTGEGPPAPITKRPDAVVRITPQRPPSSTFRTVVWGLVLTGALLAALIAVSWVAFTFFVFLGLVAGGAGVDTGWAPPPY